MAKVSKHLQAAIGGALFLAGLLWFWNSESLILFGSRAEGTVAKNIAQGRGYAAEIIFYSSPGRAERFVTTSSYNPPLYAPGQSVAVYFDAEHPERATTGGFFDRAFGPLMLAAAGVVNILLAGIRYRRQSNSSQNVQNQKSPERAVSVGERRRGG